MLLIKLCWFDFHLVGDPVGRFSHDEAQTIEQGPEIHDNLKVFRISTIIHPSLLRTISLQILKKIYRKQMSCAVGSKSGTGASLTPRKCVVVPDFRDRVSAVVCCPPPFRRKAEGHSFWLSVLPSVRPSIPLKYYVPCVRNSYSFMPILLKLYTCRRNLVLTDSLAFAIDFWMLPRYIPEHFGIFSEV